MNGGGFFESIFGGAETPNSTATSSANMSTTSGSVETPTTADNVSMSGSVKTPNEGMPASIDTSIATPNMNMPGTLETPSPLGSVEPLSDMSTSTNTISPIDNSLPEVDTPAKDASTSSSIMDTISGAYNAAKESLTNEVESVSPQTADASSPMETSSDNESIKEDDFVMDEPKSTEPVIGDLMKMLGDKDAQISNLLDQLESANKNFADANNKLVECLTSKISGDDTLAQSSPMISEMSSIGPEMSSIGPEMSSPGFPMSEANTSGSDVETPFGQ